MSLVKPEHMLNLATQKVVDIRIIKGRRQEDIDTEAATRLKIRALAEKEYKKFIDSKKVGLEAARKKYFSYNDERRRTIDSLTEALELTINEWIHSIRLNDSWTQGGYDSKVTQLFLTQFKNEYDMPTQGAQRAVCERLGFEYDKTKGLHKLLAYEVSIERQMLAMMGEGWVTQGSVTTQGSLTGGSNDIFFQTMVKYEAAAPTAPAPAPAPAPAEERTLGVRRAI